MNIQAEEQADARRGAMYFLGRTQIETVASFDLGIIDNFIGNTEILSDMKSVAMSLIPAAVTDRLAVPVEIMEKITSTLTGFFETVREKLQEIFGEGLIGIEWAGEFVAWALSTVVGSLASVIPGWGYVQSAGDLYSGIKKAVTQAAEFVRNLWGRRGFQLLDGLPTDIADALARHAAAGVASGVKGAGIASVSIGLEAAGDAAGGAGTIVSVVTNVLQRIANLIDWAIQRFRVSSVLSSARDHWEGQSELVTDQAEFSKWFRRNTLFTPIVAALVLSSGFVAHPLPVPDAVQA